MLNRSVFADEDRIAYVEVKEGHQDLWVSSITGEKSAVQVTNDLAESDIELASGW